MRWLEPVTGATEEDIESVERALGVRFPDGYRTLLLTADGGMPTESDFELDDVLASRIPAGTVPIAIGPGGDFIVLDYRTGDQPSVVYWHHEREGSPDALTFVAASFHDFVQLLHEPESGSELD